MPDRVLWALLATCLACSLPLEEKAGCEDAADCLDGRACVEGLCTDAACTRACEALCSTREGCSLDPPCLPNACDSAEPSFGGLSPAQCGVQYDLLADDACETVTCFDACAQTCALGADCALVDDPAACMLSCQHELSCEPAPQACSELDLSLIHI